MVVGWLETFVLCAGHVNKLGLDEIALFCLFIHVAGYIEDIVARKHFQLAVEFQFHFGRNGSFRLGKQG